MLTKLRWILLLSGAGASFTLVWAGGDLPTEFTNTASIINTRHNFTFSSATGADLLFNGPNIGGNTDMTVTRLTNYGQVCVYCHTPHGADTKAAAPLWNRSLPTTTTYQTYDLLHTTSLTQTVNPPGAASLPCLSCHDGQQAIDRILNMPGSGYYSTDPTNAFLDTWRIAETPYKWNGTHMKLAAPSTTTPSGCEACHSTVGTGEYFDQATNFTVGVIGTDLRDDHPVGVTYPTANGAGTDWKAPNGIAKRGAYTTTFFDENINTRMDKAEIRMYDSGNGASVECASCHDPHGVPSAGVGSQFNPTFLRKTNQSSAVCLTCHAK